MLRTRVGYAGGTKQGPTYHNLGDHAETIQIDYDPSKITYQELLGAFWTGHDPTYRNWSRQYASIIFVQTDEQRRLAEKSRTHMAKERGRTIYTEIIPYTGFTLAENYHQKHALQQFPGFQKDLQQIYPEPGAFVASTAVARVNGYLGGEGSYDELLREADGLGLSSARKEELIKLVHRQKQKQTCPVPEKGAIAR